MIYKSTTFILIVFTTLIAISPSSYSDEHRDHDEALLYFEDYALTDSLDYSAEIIRYLMNERKVIFDGNATVNYQGHTLKSARIVYYQDYDYLEATGVKDSSGTLVNTPVFTDPTGQEMHGLVIKYDLETQKGFIQRGRTKYESGYMAANRIKRAADDTLFIADGTYTTCDHEDNPHYYFAGKRMKFILNDKLIIKPIVGYVSDIPVFWFPFYVFPIKKGRQSGFLMPRYGSSRRDGRYFSNLGYYFAPSDYIDYKVAGTLRERNGWLVKNWFNYNQRHNMSGSVFGSWENRDTSDGSTRQYKFRMSHRQTITPSLTLDGSGQFESSSYSQYNSNNLYERMNRDTRSTLTLTKRWRESGNSMIITTSYTKNLDKNSRTTSAPNISFTKPRKLLFGGKKTTKRKYTASGPEPEQHWYNSIYYSLNARLNNSDRKTETSNDFTRNMKLSTSLSTSQKLMGWLVSEPSLSLNEDLTVTNTSEKDERYQRKDNISAGMRFGTTVYGMFKPSIGDVSALRHVITPSLSWSYGKRREYFGEDAETFYRLDMNENDDGRTHSMNFSLRNLFQMKTVKEDKENKLDLFRLDFSGSVNLEAEERKISPLRTSFDFKPFKIFTTRLTASHDFYNDDDEFDILNPYLNNMSVTTNIGLSQKSLGFRGRSMRENANASLGGDDFDVMEDASPVEGESGNQSGNSLLKSMNVRLSHMYGLRRSRQPGKDKYNPTHNIKPEFSFSPSRNFSIRYYLYYDIEDQDIVDQRIMIHRDLHCWEANISWVPAGYREGFYFKVNIKELPDVKVEQRRGSSTIGY